MGKWTVLKQRIQEAWLYNNGYKEMPKHQTRFIEQLRKRETPIRVAFFPLNVSMWKYQGIYDLLKADSRFQVYIVLSPGITYKREQRLRDLAQMREYFGARGMEYIDWALENDEPPADIRHTLNPDIVFYTQPYHGSYHSRHFFLNFTDKLIIYSPYFYIMGPYRDNYDNVLQNVAWKCYFVNKYHINDAQRITHNKGVNAVAVGYTSADDYHQNQYKEVWKNAGEQRKRLIWAPHWTLANDGTAGSHSHFLKMADFMVALAKKHTNDLQIAFKPHPGLLSALYIHPEWGQEKADSYYNLWRTMPNTQLVDGPFINLFQGSDAMVHDSGSFVIDYLFFNHPVMYISSNIEHRKKFVNEPGKKAFDAHYIGSCAEDVERFVNEVVLAGADTMQTTRQEFYQQYLSQPGGQSTAQNMYDDIVKSLNL